MLLNQTKSHMYTYKEAIHAYFNDIQRGRHWDNDKSDKCLSVLIDKRLSVKNMDVVCKNITAVTALSPEA